MARQEGVGRGHGREVELLGLALLHEDFAVIAFAEAGAQDGVVENVGIGSERSCRSGALPDQLHGARQGAKHDRKLASALQGWPSVPDKWLLG